MDYYNESLRIQVGPGLVELVGSRISYKDFPCTYRTIIQGETLESIAYSVWGDSGMWPYIAFANNIFCQWELTPGQNIKIPIFNG